MLELVTEILIYLAIAALIGFLLGFLVWGWGRRARLDAARAEGAASVRTSMHGDSAHETQLAECQKQRKRLELSLERAKDQINDLQTELEEARASANWASEAMSEQGAADAEASIDEDMAASDSADDVEESLDAEIDLPSETEEEMPSPGGRRLFITDDIDPRISGIEPEDEAQTVAEPSPQAEDQTAAPTPKSLLAERPDEVDDLKEIKGVGRVMEGVLNDKGVYLFHQIANFSDEDVAWVNEAIEAFPGRIERDNWVGQAQNLYRAKYGQAHDD